MSGTDQAAPSLVIVRRRGGDGDGGHHGGMWKIAFADFMTAMMAFFLVMWLINVSDDEKVRKIALYFNPLPTNSKQLPQKGVHEEQHDKKNIEESEKEGTGKFVRKFSDEELMKDPEGVVKKILSQTSPEPKQTPPNAPKNKKNARMFLEKGGKINASKPSGGQASNIGTTAKVNKGLSTTLNLPLLIATPEVPAKKSAKGGRVAVSQNKPETNAQREASTNDRQRKAPSNINKKSQNADQKTLQKNALMLAKPGASARQVNDGKEKHTEQHQKTGPAKTIQKNALMLAKPGASARQVNDGKEKHAEQHQKTGPAKIIQKKTGPVKTITSRKKLSGSAGSEQKRRDDIKDLQKLKHEIAKLIQPSKPGTIPRVLVERTPEGILISLMDEFDYGMFAIGSAEPHPHFARLVRDLAHILTQRKEHIVVRGHTDGRPYKSKKNLDNWRLSTMRAHMARYLLKAGGVASDRILKLEGFADRRLRIPSNPFAAQNRRIEILLRTTKQ